MLHRIDGTGRVLRGILLAGLMFLIVICAAERGSAAVAGPLSSARVRYESVKITRGDTLESIADQYNDPSVSSDELYIAELKAVNGMRGERLRPGCYLSVMRVN